MRPRLPGCRRPARRPARRRSSRGSRSPAPNSYFVVVAKDANFSNIVDEAFTHIPAYAPRNSLKPTTYTDETTSYYWAVLPARTSPTATTRRRSRWPALRRARSRSSRLRRRWSRRARCRPSPTSRPSAGRRAGARRYRLQVAADPTFGNPLDDVVTDATSYSSDTTYPADTVLYWRVRADDENLTGLTWSATGTFQKKLAGAGRQRLEPDPGRVAAGLGLELRCRAPPRTTSRSTSRTVTHRDYSDIRTPAASFIKMTGTGVWHWRVRAEFPKDWHRHRARALLATQSFTRTIGEPANAKTDSAKDHVLLSWDPRLGVKEYKVQIASSPGLQPRRGDGLDRQSRATRPR